MNECCEILSQQWPNDAPSIPSKFTGEVFMWKRTWQKKCEEYPCDFITSLNECDKNIFPNVHTFLKLGATLPITTATAERSFSSLRRLKNYLRNSTSQNRLNGLALMSIHRDIVVDPEEVINKLSKKPRKLGFTL